MSLKILGFAMVLAGGLALAQPPAPTPPPRAPVMAISPADVEKLMGGATLLSLHLKDANIERLRFELEKQLKQPVRLGEIEEEQRKLPLTVDWDKKPFWEAMRLLAETYNLRLMPDGRREWQLISGGQGEMRGKQLASPGVARVALQRVSRSYDIDFTGDESARTGLGERNNQMSAQFVVTLDPKLDVLTQMASTSSMTAAAAGAQVAIAHDVMGFYNQSPQTWNLDVPLAQLDGPNRKAFSLKGALRFYVVTRWERWDVPLETKGAKTVVDATEGEETYTLRDFKKTEDGYQLQLAIKAPLVIAPGPEQGTPLARQLRDARRDLGQWARLTDAEGRTYVSQTGENKSDLVEILFVPGTPPDDSAPPKKLGAPQKLTLLFPAEVRELEIPFDYKDLPLP